MTLMSPTPTTTTTSRPLYSHNPRRFVFPTTQSLREHSVESDGYSEVFDGDDLSSNTNTLPSGLTGLMNAPFTSSTTKKEVCVCVCVHHSLTLCMQEQANDVIFLPRFYSHFISLQSIPHPWCSLSQGWEQHGSR